MQAITYLQAEKEYRKTYFVDGTPRSEGWMIAGAKTEYWYFYEPAGWISSKGVYKNNKPTGYWFFYSSKDRLREEGHFLDGEKTDWWISYPTRDTLRKTQYSDGKKNGFCLVYKKGSLVKAEKYENDVYKGSWTTIASFKRDNPHATF